MESSKLRVRVGLSGDGELQEVEVRAEERSSTLPELLGMEISKFEKITIVLGNKTFSSGINVGTLLDITNPCDTQAKTKHPEVLVIIDTDFNAISNALTTPMRYVYNREEGNQMAANAGAALCKLRMIGVTPISVANAVIEAIIECSKNAKDSRGSLNFAKDSWGSLNLSWNVISRVVSLVGQSCEDPDAVANLLLDNLNSDVHFMIGEPLAVISKLVNLWLYMMLLEVCLRLPGILERDPATKAILMKGAGLLDQLVEEMKGHRRSRVDIIAAVNAIQASVRAYMKTLMRFVPKCGGKVIAQAFLKDLETYHIFVKDERYHCPLHLDELKDYIETLKAFVVSFDEECPYVPDYVMLQDALLENDTTSCHLLASKLLGLPINGDDEKSGRNGQLKSAGSLSSRSSWRRAAQALPDVEVVSQATPDPWDGNSSMGKNSIPQNASELLQNAQYVPQKPPGLLLANEVMTAPEVGFSASLNAAPSLHAPGASLSAYTEGPSSFQSTGDGNVSALGHVDQTAPGHGTAKTKKDNRRKKQRRKQKRNNMQESSSTNAKD